eukprot:210172_1
MAEQPKDDEEKKESLYSKRFVQRREIRSLSDDERKRFFHALETMMQNKVDDDNKEITGSPQQTKTLQIFVAKSGANGETLKIDASEDSTINDIKKALYKKSGISVSQQVLLYEGKPLEGKRNVKDYNISSEATLLVYGKLNGGADDCLDNCCKCCCCQCCGDCDGCGDCNCDCGGC